MKERRIGIMGGTFNPVHYAHLLLAESAREQFQLDRVIFIPTGFPYMKDTTGLPSGELRYQLVKIATKDNPYFTCSRIEIDRPGNTYTADTLKELKRLYPGDHLFFIMGADSVMDIEKWNRISEIFSSTSILAAVRKKVDTEALQERCEELNIKYGADIQILEYGRMDVSSTLIRSRLKQGLSVRYLLPDECIDFIRTHDFYTDKPDAGLNDVPSRVYVPKKERKN